ncbi:polysaccharide deacetylase family protein [Aggregicoccus sp. 17bor-14]|uniref:polysaccharide deacetylase family protein n=1 Tax=Myxococcaceae TaxID=31 RepID=UPI00129C943F|nr:MULTISPECIES: polysaccharide deacetylase family protein [Myxococcaceae]MBF5042850.1 polysaccharide deacetylase family protein [Simulacricoccus sp. 17bor-14]MRI88617.1 polysaccharide deacetylase family protein [Aggregicoccus sp. 17bor-14]
MRTGPLASVSLASASVDLDSLPHYCRIHGLDERLLDERARRLVYGVALPRLLECFERAGAPATLFAIGEDLALPGASAALAAAHASGHEVASHSFSHDYALSRRAPGDILEDLARADAALEAATGRAPVGFRAPGYTLSAALYRACEARGYRYASSTFPAAPYYAAKATVMGALALARRPSRSVLDSPRVLLAPRTPYWPDPAAPYRRGEGRVLELPVSVTPGLRFPVIGTFVATLPGAVTASLYRALRRDALFNLELHAVDALDASDGIPEALVRRQRDLRVRASLKLERLAALLARVRAERELLPLCQAAERLAPQGRPSGADAP